MAAAHSSSPADTQDSLGELTRRIVLAFALLAVMATMPLYQRLALYEFDFLSSLTAPAPPDAGILVVGLDEASLAQLGVAPPLPRRLHAQLVRALTDAGAAALGVDMLFAEPQTVLDDEALGQALKGGLPIVLAGAAVQNDSSQVAQYVQQLPTVFPEATRGAAGMVPDEDGIARRAPMQPDALWRVLAQQAGRQVSAPPDGALLRYYAPELPIPYAHYTQALDAQHALAPGAVQGRLVLLGQNTPVGGVDQFRTPFSALGGATQSGVFLHATALLNGLTNDWIRPVPWPLTWLAALLAMVGISLFMRRFSALRALAASLALGGAAVVAGVFAFVAGWWFSVLPLLTGLAVHWNLGAAQSYLRERGRRQRLRADFARYVPPAVVDALMASGAMAHVHGERRVLTLLFCDLAGFTAASETLAPEAVARALNAYFTRMAHCVRSHGGTLDKFIGDAVMAFWNAPLPDAAHAARGLACAQAMQADMELLRSDWRGTPFAAVRLRVGVHTGEAAVGHMGSTERFTYTAVGDAVNTAARLEGANKALGTEILVSGATVDTLDAQLQGTLLWLDCVLLAGRSSGLDVYTPCSDAALVAQGAALRAHIHAGRLQIALALCEEWLAQNGGAPAHAAAAMALAERLRAALNVLPDGAGSAASSALPPRQLSK